MIARVSNAGSINTFDITPDGTRIVFDRVEERSNLVLIERPQRDNEADRLRDAARRIGLVFTISHTASAPQSYWQVSEICFIESTRM